MSRPKPPVQTKPCVVCDAPIVRPTGKRRISARQWAEIQACAGKCSTTFGWNKRKTHPPARVDRFALFAPSSGDGCWEWTGPLSTTGYGRLGRCLTAQRIAIRAAIARGVARKSLSERFGTGMAAINQIASGRTWRHLLPQEVRS